MGAEGRELRLQKGSTQGSGDAAVLYLDGNADHTSPHVMINSPAVNYMHARSGGHIELVKGG